MNLSTRATTPELMDDLGLATEELRQNLDELETINTWLGGYQPVLAALARLRARFPQGRPLRLADLGSGGGDTLRHISTWARRRGVGVELTGIDANAFMLSYASAKSAAYPEIGYQQVDIFSPEFAAQHYDVLTASLFCHHFTDAELVQLLRGWQQQAGVAVIINDLHRHPLAYHSIKYLTRWLGGSKRCAAVGSPGLHPRRLAAPAGTSWHRAVRIALVLGLPLASNHCCVASSAKVVSAPARTCPY
jgi:SAM-dependent methyltransferase